MVAICVQTEKAKKWEEHRVPLLSCDDMDSVANEYRKRAEEYRRLASETADDIIAACLIELAETYEEAADTSKHSPPDASPPE